MWHLLPWQGLALSMLVPWILALKAWWCCLHFQAALLPLSPQPPLLLT